MLSNLNLVERVCVRQKGSFQVNDELACILNLKLIINHFSSRITLRPEDARHTFEAGLFSVR